MTVKALFFTLGSFLFTSCSGVNDGDLLVLKKQVEDQQKQITSLEKSQSEFIKQTSQITREYNKLKAHANSYSEIGTINSRMRSIDARLDRDELIINRIGRRASDAYNHSANSYMPR